MAHKVPSDFHILWLIMHLVAFYFLTHTIKVAIVLKLGTFSGTVSYNSEYVMFHNGTRKSWLFPPSLSSRKKLEGLQQRKTCLLLVACPLWNRFLSIAIYAFPLHFCFFLQRETYGNLLLLKSYFTQWNGFEVLLRVFNFSSSFSTFPFEADKHYSLN